MNEKLQNLISGLSSFLNRGQETSLAETKLNIGTDFLPESFDLSSFLPSAQKFGQQVREKIGEPLAEKIISTPEIRQERMSKAAKILNIPETILGGIATKTTPKEGEGLMEYLNRVPYYGDVVAQRIKEKGLVDDPKALSAISMAVGFVIPNIPGGEAAKKGKVVGELLPTGKISKELEPLAQEARKYKSAEEFVKSYDGGLILDRGKVNNWIAGGPDNTVPVSEILGLEGKKFMKENGLPDISVRIQEAGEETIGHYAQIEWRGGNRLKDARINIEISPTEEFGVESLGVMEKNLLHELAHAKQIMLNRLGNKKIQGAISENAAEKHANYILSQTKSQLIDLWNKAQSGKLNLTKLGQDIQTQLVPLKPK